MLADENRLTSFQNKKINVDILQSQISVKIPFYGTKGFIIFKKEEQYSTNLFFFFANIV